MRIDIPQVMVPSMNATHAEEVEILRMLEAALDGTDDAAIAEAARAFADHVEVHFSREEELMRAHAFPPYPIHKGEHDRMRGIVRELCGNCDNDAGRAALLSFIRRDFPAWLGQHVSTLDTVTAQFLSMHGVE